MDVSSYRYRSRRPDDRPVARATARLWRRSVAGSATGVLAWLLEREGTKVNLKKVYRLYREEGSGGEASARTPPGHWRPCADRRAAGR